MLKENAIKALGGTGARTARRVGLTRSAIAQWPDVLPARIEDRVLAAWTRANVAAETLRALGFTVTTQAPEKA